MRRSTNLRRKNHEMIKPKQKYRSEVRLIVPLYMRIKTQAHLLLHEYKRRKEAFVLSMERLSQEKAYRIMLKKYPDVLDIKQMCEILSISLKTGYGLIQENKIECLKVGRAYRIPKPFLLSYLRIGASSDNKLK